MNVIRFLIITLFLLPSFSFGQPLPGNPGMRNNQPVLRSQEPFIVDTDQPLIIIGTLETTYNSLIMDLENLKILEAYTDSAKLAYFGEKGEAGVIIAELKHKTPLLRLEEVLDYFQVPAANRHLKVLIDKKFMNPALFLADIKQIKRIECLEVTQQDILLSPFYKNAWVLGEKYLNVVTKE